MPWNPMMMMMLGLLIGAAMHRQGHHRPSLSMPLLKNAMTQPRMETTTRQLQMQQKPTTVTQTPGRSPAPTRHPSSASSAPWWMSCSPWRNANGERRWRIWTSKRWLIWADGSCVGHTYAAGRASLLHSPDGHGTLTRLGRSMIRRMKTSTTWSSVMMPYELYNAAWLWSGGFRCRRTTRSSAKGNWVDDKGLSCGASARPRGKRRCAMRDTACACSPGGAGSSKFTLLWRLHAGQHRWPAGRSRYQRAQLFQWPDPGLCALCAHLRRPWQPTLIYTKLPSCFPNLKPQPPHDSPIGQASWSFRHANGRCDAAAAGRRLRYHGGPTGLCCDFWFGWGSSSRELKPRSSPGHATPAQSRSGPKSGRRALMLICVHLQHRAAVGARVASTTAVEVGPGSAELGKHCGPVPGAPQGPSPTPKTSEKRAYRRARLRAAHKGGTYYRGRWHTAADLKALPYTPTPPMPRSLRAAPRRRKARYPSVQCFSWNAGGLSSAVYQELVSWLDVQGTFQIAVLQESHWPHCSDYTSGNWMCIHSASDPDAAYDRYAGVMVMLSKQHFQDPAVHEIHKGRVLHVRATHKLTQTRIDVLAVYQHVWRSHLSTQQNHDLRGAVWQHLHEACARLPARNFLLLCGDFNATVQPERYAAGPASLPSDTSYPDRQLNRLLAAHSLCALNTWHASPAYTHYSHTGQTQIDFVITRRSTAGQASKQARPLIDFPVARWRLSGHLPL